MKDTNEDLQSYQIKAQFQQQKLLQIKNQLSILLKKKCFNNAFMEKLKLLKTNLQKLQINNNSNKSAFVNVNSKFSCLQEQIQESKERIKRIHKNKQNQDLNLSKQPNKSIKCSQSSHLRQIFKTTQSQKRISELKGKKENIYKKISIALSTQQPYIWEKILDKIKKIAKYKSKLTLSSQIKKKIKLNEDWIKKQTLKLQSNLVQKQLQQNCVNSLNRMKAIMAKKININDYIYEHMSSQKNQQSSLYLNLNKLKQKYESRIKHFNEELILIQQ